MQRADALNPLKDKGSSLSEMWGTFFRGKSCFKEGTTAWT